MKLTQILESVTAGGMGTGSFATAPSAGKTIIRRQQKENIDPADQGEYDREGDMARDQLYTAAEAAAELRSILDSNENLPEWVQSKITKAVDYLDTARDYMKSKEQGVAEGSEERSQNRLWQMITDYEKRAKATSNDIKKAHYLKMAQELRYKLKTSDEQGVEEAGFGNKYRDKARDEGEPEGYFDVLSKSKDGWKVLATKRSNQAFYYASNLANKYPDREFAVRWPDGTINRVGAQKFEENKKGVRAVKHTVKPRNPVAKNAMAGIGGGAAGAHKDKKKAQKQGDVKHKGKELSYESILWTKLEKRIVK